MKDKETKYPQLRFKGFDDPWEQRKLGDISRVIDPHPSHRAPVATEKGIPFIGIGDVDEIGNINYKTSRIVDEKIYDEHHNRYDLSIPSIGIGRVASLGKVIRLRDDIGKYAVSPTMSVIQFSYTNDLDFLYANMNTPLFQKQFKSFSNGSTRQSVGIQDLRILLISLPNDLKEQQKIGSFFKQLDNTIALHQRKLAKLKELKQGYLQKLFPKNGSKFPQLRFAGFADAWERRKLGEITTSFDSQRMPLESSTRQSGSYPYYGATGVIDSVNDYIFDGEYVLLAEDGANIVTRTSPIAYLTHGKFWLNNHAHIMKVREGSDYFLLSLLEKIDYSKLNSGTAQPKLNAKTVSGLNIMIPTAQEQMHIAALLRSFDDTIALHQRKLEKLQELKKGYLQKMFC